MTELMAASVIMTLIAGALSTLALAVQGASSYCSGQTTAGQHGRVVIHRLEQAIYDAHASTQFPGCVVFTDDVGAYDFPDTLVVWRPDGNAANPDARPLVRELVVFCPDPGNPHRLMELRHPGNNASAPALSNMSAWTTLLANLKANATSRIELTDRLRTASTDIGSSTPNARSYRAALRFNVLMAPSEQQWNQYKAGTRDWDELDWPLDMYGSQMGQRTIVCQFELQILTGEGSSDDASLPFFGSASVTCGLPR